MSFFESVRTTFGGTRTVWPPDSVEKRWTHIDYNRRLVEAEPGFMSGVVSRKYGFTQSRYGYVSVPLAKLITRTKANLVAGEPPLITTDNPDDAETLSNRFLKPNFFHQRVLAGFRQSSMEGAQIVKLSVAEDNQGNLRPAFQVLSERNCVVELDALGNLETLSIITVEDRSKNYIRVVERHQRDARVYYSVWSGSDAGIGKQIAIEDPMSPEWVQALLPQMDQHYSIDNGTNGQCMTVWYIPNQADSRGYGVSDIEGIDALMAAVNQSATLTLREQDASRTRIIADASLMDDKGALNRDAAVIWARTQSGTADEDMGSLITTVQSTFSADAYLKTQDSLIDLTLAMTGISPATVGRDVNGGNGKSGIAKRADMQQTAYEVASTAAYAEQMYSEVLETAILVDILQCGGQYSFNAVAEDGTKGKLNDIQVTLELRDGLPFDATEDVDVATKAVSAGVMSKRSAIKRLNPSFTPAQIEEELQAILEDEKSEQAVLQDAANGAVAGLTLPQAPVIN